MFGYAGKIGRVNLTDGTVRYEHPDNNFYRKYFGGRGIIGYYLLKEVPPHVDPLGAENKLIFATGLVTGTPVAGSGRHSVGAKSPLTGGWGEAEAGGFWGTELKRAGLDALIIEGKSPKPVYLWVTNDGIEIKDAEHLWGLKTKETQEKIREELGDKNIKVAQIGPGGERLVRYACIINDLHDAAGRSGLGAVMGSKLLKAVAVKGNKNIEIADKEKLREISKRFNERFPRLNWGLREYGTSQDVLSLNAAGGLPTRNFKEGVFEGAESISGERMAETILIDRESCYACPVKCKRVVKVDEPFEVDPVYGGPEYETMAAFGSNCGNSDQLVIAKANELCNAYGLDTISTAMSISFAMECYENGIIDKEKTDGLELKFGNGEAIIELVEKIANRKGLGAVLADGVEASVKYFGEESRKYAMHVKGQYLPMHEPRMKNGVGFGYAVAPTGADHLQMAHDPAFEVEGDFFDMIRPFGINNPIPSRSLGNDKMRFVTYMQCWASVLNMLDICFFLATPPSPYRAEDIVEMVEAITGWDTSLWELMKVGERGLALARMVNVSNGIKVNSDCLPERFFEKLPSGPLAGISIDKELFTDAMRNYYSYFGWDEDSGCVSDHKLAELGLEWIKNCS